jgi:FlaA1/EpsC-like NDP-sugar epimerase
VKEHPVFRYRYVLKLFLHGFIFVSAYLGAYILRFEFEIPPSYVALIRETIPVVLLSKAVGFFAFGLFFGWWRYVTIRDILPIAAGCTLGSFLFYGIVSLFQPHLLLPRSVYLIDWGLTLMTVLLSAVPHPLVGKRSGAGGDSTGASDRWRGGGSIDRHEIRENPSLGMIAVVSWTTIGRSARRIDGVPVLGATRTSRNFARNTGSTDHHCHSLGGAVPPAAYPQPLPRRESQGPNPSGSGGPDRRQGRRTGAS